MEELLKTMTHSPIVKPFICISMDCPDLQQDVAYLLNNTFPSLDKAFKRRGSAFSPIFMTLDGKEYLTKRPYKYDLIYYYLANIDEATPYFIGIIGNHYGMGLFTECEESDSDPAFQWYQRNLENAARNGYDWVLQDENRYSSLLELGVTAAVFRRKIDFAYFYYKEETRDLVPLEESLQVNFADKKLKDLKQQIIDTHLPVATFGSQEELGDHVMNDWMKALNILYPPLDARLLTPNVEVFFEEQVNIEAEIHNYCKHFIHTQETEQVLKAMRDHVECLLVTEAKKTSFYALPVSTSKRSSDAESKISNMAESSHPILLLTGPRGSGKSALIGSFLNSLKGVKLICPLFVCLGNGLCQRQDTISFLKRVIMRMRAWYKQDQIALCEEDMILSARETVDAFRNCLTYGPCLIVVDGLDYLRFCSFLNSNQPLELNWLPDSIPPSSRIILTSTDIDHWVTQLERRSDVHTLHVDVALNMDQESMLASSLALGSSQNTLEAFISKINTMKHNGNPFFVVAMSNLIGTSCMPDLLGAPLPETYEPPNISSLWRFIIRLWSGGVGWWLTSATEELSGSRHKRQTTGKRTNFKGQPLLGWVVDVLRLIAVSRSGMNEKKILSCLQKIGYRDKYAVSSHDLRIFLNVSRHAVFQDRHGFLHFAHATLLEAVDRFLLQGCTYPLHYRPVSSFEVEWEKQRKEFHLLVADHSSLGEHGSRDFAEFLWQLFVLRDEARLARAMANTSCFLSFVTSLPSSDQYMDLTDYVLSFKAEENQFDRIVCKMLEMAQERVDSNQVNTRYSEDMEKRSILSSLMSKSGDDTLTPGEYICLQYLAAKALFRFNFLSSAEEILVSAAHNGYMFLGAQDQDILSLIHLTLGEIYLKNSNSALATEQLAEAESAIGSIDQPWNVDENYLSFMHGKIIVQQTYLQLTAEFPASPDELPVQLTQTRRPFTATSGRSQVSSWSKGTKRLVPVNSAARSFPTSSRPISGWHPSPLPITKNSVTYTELKSRFELARKFFTRAGSELGRATVLRHLGVLAHRFKDLDVSEHYLRQSISIYRDWYGSNHPMLAEALDELASTLASREEVLSRAAIKEAEDLLRQGMQMRTQSTGASSLSIAKSYYQLGRILVSKRRRDATREAQDLLQKALDILVSEKGFYHPETVGMRQALFDLYKEPISYPRRPKTVTFPMLLCSSVSAPGRFSKR